MTDASAHNLNAAALLQVEAEKRMKQIENKYLFLRCPTFSYIQDQWSNLYCDLAPVVLKSSGANVLDERLLSEMTRAGPASKA